MASHLTCICTVHSFWSLFYLVWSILVLVNHPEVIPLHTTICGPPVDSCDDSFVWWSLSVAEAHPLVDSNLGLTVGYMTRVLGPSPSHTEEH